MKGERRDTGRRATAWMVTCFVLAGGATTCLVMSVTLWDDPKWPLAGVAAGAVLAGALVWSLRGTPDPDSPGRLRVWLLSRPSSVATHRAYRPGRRLDSPPVETPANAPPSVERIRELADGPHNWRPSGSARSVSSHARPHPQS